MPSSSSSSNAYQDPNWSYDPYTSMDAQMKMIITCGLPFDFFDGDLHDEFFQSLQPLYERVSTSTIKRQALKHYRSASNYLISYFKRFEGKVCLTIRKWNTSYELSPYICVFCHWIDPETWKASYRVIGIQFFECPLDAKEISDFVVSCVSEFNVKDKIVSIGLADDDDGVFENVVETVKRELNPVSNGVLFRTKCVSGFLNLMVKSTLDHASSLLSKFEKMVDSVYYTETRYDFTEFVKSKDAKFCYPWSLDPEKWNTTCRRLDFLVKQRSLLAEFFTKCGKYDIDDNDWENIESLHGILEVFRSSTVLLCNAYNPTIPLVLGQCLLISDMFKQHKENPFWKPLISDLQSKFLKYFETMAPIFYCATVLDPAIGVGGVENIFEDIEVNLGLNGSGTFNLVKCGEVLREVFDDYDKTYNKSRSRALVPFNGSSTSRSIILQSVSRKSSKSVTISNDLELYAKTDFSNLMSVDEDEDLNLFEWWRTKGCNQYPVLGKMVRDILTIQASSVTLRYAFCFKGKTLDDTTTYLSTKTYRLRIFLKEQFKTKYETNLVEDSSSGESEDDDEDEDEDELEDEFVNTDVDDSEYEDGAEEPIDISTLRRVVHTESDCDF